VVLLGRLADSDIALDSFASIFVDDVSAADDFCNSDTAVADMHLRCQLSQSNELTDSWTDYSSCRLAMLQQSCHQSASRIGTMLSDQHTQLVLP